VSGGRGRFSLELDVALAALLGVVALAAVYAAGRSDNPAVCPATTIADEVLPSVVTISVTSAGGGGSGSGEVIRSDGYILTNDHVISAAASGGQVQVTFADGTTVDATITGRDPRTDVAVLHVAPPYDLRVIEIGSATSLQVGQPLVALGAPLGLSSTVTGGIVSALDRTVHVPTGSGPPALLVSAIQTDASINPGNSGGALVDCDGRLVGVPTAIASLSGGSIGLGFAIPVELAMTIADELIQTGTVQHSTFGLQTVPISPQAATLSGKPEGLFVQAVAPGGPAAEAGLRPGDVITKIDGEAARDNVQLEALTLTKKPGETVELEVYRNGATTQTTVTLASA